MGEPLEICRLERLSETGAVVGVEGTCSVLDCVVKALLDPDEIIEITEGNCRKEITWCGSAVRFDNY